MKLKSLNTIVAMDKEELKFINGGSLPPRHHTRGHDTTHNDSLKHDGGASINY